MITINNKLIIFPFLFSIFPVILLYSENVTEIKISDFLFPLILTFLIALTSFVFLNFFLKNSLKTGFIVSLLTTAFFSYGYVFNILETTFLFDSGLLRHIFVLIPFGLFLIVGIYYTVKTKRNLNGFRSVFNVISIVMILSISPNIVTFYIDYEPEPEYDRSSRIIDNKHILEFPFSQNQIFPNIYHIVLDEYTSSHVLQNDFQYDNSDFITNLKNLNFVIPSNPLSNYPATEYFLSSTLNLKYLEDSKLKMFERLNIDDTINDNFVMQFLKEYNYKIIVPYSGYGPPDKFLASDENICSEVTLLTNKFLLELFRTTIINYLIENQIENERRHIQLCTLSELANIWKENTQPTYVFAHLFIPHPPYLFDKDGNSVSPLSNNLKGLQGWNNTDGYLNEIQFINKKIESISTEILTHSKNSIIIIQGDTGSSILDDPKTDDFIKKRLSILFAIYLPNINEDVFPDTTSSANIYRVIFNNYFETDYNLLPDRYFYNSNLGGLVDPTDYEIIEVTDMIISPAN